MKYLKNTFLILVSYFLMTTLLFGQMMDVSSILQTTTDFNDKQSLMNSEEKVLEQLSSSILKTVFIEPIVMGQYYNFVGEDSLFESDNGIQQEMLVKILSDSLAKQDILRLKQHYIKQNSATGLNEFNEFNQYNDNDNEMEFY